LWIVLSFCQKSWQLRWIRHIRRWCFLDVLILTLLLTIIHSLSKSRKKRPVPEGWVSADEVSSFEPTTVNSLPVPQATALDLEGSYAVAGGLNGEAAIYSIEADNVERTVPVNEPVTDTLWSGSKVFFATSQGNIKVYEAGNEIGTLSEHAGAASGLSLHPSGELLASVGTDKSIVFYQLETLKRVARAYADACKLDSSRALSPLP
jgi:pre-mRNA-processing factor 19